MIRANLGLVPFVAKTYLGQGLDLEELINEGIVGLILGVQKFDYKRGLKFSNVGVWWIRYALTVGTANNGRVIRVPRSVHAEIIKVRRAEGRMLTSHGPVSDGELASAIGLSEKRVREVRQLARPIGSLDATLVDDSDFSLTNVIADRSSPSPLDLVIANEITNKLSDIFGTLTETEMRYLDFRYGLTTGQPRSQKWIRENLNLDSSEVKVMQRRIDSLMQHARLQDELTYSY
jgi:RNA polymerase primary sigma factor